MDLHVGLSHKPTELDKSDPAQRSPLKFEEQQEEAQGTSSSPHKFHSLTLYSPSSSGDTLPTYPDTSVSAITLTTESLGNEPKSGTSNATDDADRQTQPPLANSCRSALVMARPRRDSTLKTSSRQRLGRSLSISIDTPAQDLLKPATTATAVTTSPKCPEQLITCQPLSFGGASPYAMSHNTEQSTRMVVVMRVL
eukprot:TRINITY_DN65794_c0_g1_i3.p1 TRINITY_DN65794_c0_g1~~TRINITY_DN65794_c0_g1_i3.p1  ORF type:complete len:196 (-),score=21.99 TRINITY_DN65794_c0_g1_i3:219-806(-)